MAHERQPPPRAGETPGGGDASGLTVKIPPDVSAKVREEARRAGIPPEEWVRGLVSGTTSRTRVPQ